MQLIVRVDLHDGEQRDTWRQMRWSWRLEMNRFSGGTNLGI